MDILRTLATLCLAGGLSMTAGCSGKIAPVNNVDNAPIYQNAGPMDLQQVRDLLVASLTDEGWGVLDESQGWVLAQHKVDDHWAKIRITYDEKSYTILHFESSPGLSYNGAEIHRRYNGWIEDLDEEIQDRLRPSDDDDEDEDEDEDDGDDGDDDDDDDEADDDDDDAAAEATAVPGEGPAPDPDPSWTEAQPSGDAAPPPS